MTEIQHSINLGTISNPLTRSSDQALVTLANEICNLKDLGETNVIEETSKIVGNVDIGVAALVRAIEKTAIECDEVSHLIEVSKHFTKPTSKIEKELGKVSVDGYGGVNITIHEDDILINDVEDVVEYDGKGTSKHIQPLDIISESNISEVNIDFISTY